MIDLVYVLCAAASLACTVLLWRAWRRTGTLLLKRSAWCFVGLFLNNLLLIVDLRVVPDIDLALLRLVPALVGACILVFSLVWDSQ